MTETEESRARVVSFNNHWPNPVDYSWRGSLPITPDVCFGAVFDWMAKLGLEKDRVHTVVVPGVRESLVLAAYHALMGHFPNVAYSMRKDGRYVWSVSPLQEWRDDARGERR